MAEGYLVVGKRQVESKDKTRVYTSYYCLVDFSPYEKDNCLAYEGSSCEEIQTTEHFPIDVGDRVQFYYGKARGDWQPVIDFKMIKKADPPAKK